MPVKSVPIQLDRPRKLRFDMDAMSEFENLEGLSILEWMANFNDKGGMGLKVKQLRALLWAGLLHEDATLTPKRTGELVEENVPGDGFIAKMNVFLPRLIEAILGGIGGEDAKKKLQEEALKEAEEAAQEAAQEAALEEVLKEPSTETT